MSKKWNMVIDLASCNDCNCCFMADKDEFTGNDWAPYSVAQPWEGARWLEVERKERGQFPQIQVANLATLCMQCDNAPCVEAAAGGAVYKREDGIVIIDPAKCRGNQLCMEACPYENVIYFNDDLNIAQKCTFCAHLLDDGWEEPRCVDSCPTGAFTFGDEDDPKIKELIAKAELLKPELAHVKPRVYYIGLPKKFIAGAIYDKEADECTEGATVTATSVDTGEKCSAVTDSYGDFWLKDLKDGKYTLLIEKSGYLTQKIGPVDVTKMDVNVGDIEIWKV
jgi:Fe-S-cluster-containing dehydrogenase component